MAPNGPLVATLDRVHDLLVAALPRQTTTRQRVGLRVAIAEVARLKVEIGEGPISAGLIAEFERLIETIDHTRELSTVYVLQTLRMIAVRARDEAPRNEPTMEGAG